MANSFSPSTLKILKDCPRCFWLHFHGKKRPRGIFPSLPGGMDKILKVHFDRFIGRGLPPELSSLQGYELFDDMVKLRLWRNNFGGLQWKDAEGNTFRGAIDNILTKDGKLVILDYKTRGYPLKENTADFYKDQLDVYTLLLQKEGYETEDHAFLVFYHPDKVEEDGTVSFYADIVKMEVSVERAERLFKDAIACVEGEEPAAAEGCEYCKYRGSV